MALPTAAGSDQTRVVEPHRGPAAVRWAADLESWAIPPTILDQAPEPPWGFPVTAFARRVRSSRTTPSPARRRALEALEPGGSVLDVGAGAGAAGLALVPPASELVAVDADAAMLAELQRQVATVTDDTGLTLTTVQGRWPDVAATVPDADVAVCHHVLFNVADAVPFVTALTEHARRRVVVVVADRHPLSWMNSLWQRFWGIDRPSGPTADDLQEVLVEAGIAARREDMDEPDDPLGAEEDTAAQVALVRRRLCLPAERDPEVAAALAELPPRRRRSAVLWWDPPS